MYTQDSSSEAIITQAVSVVKRKDKPLLTRVGIESPVRFSLSFARINGTTEAILFYHLQLSTLGQYAVVRNGRTWIAHYPLSEFLIDLPCFTNRQTVYEGLQRLEGKGFVLIYSELKAIEAGALIDGGYVAGMGRPPKPRRGMEGRSWYYVQPFTRLPGDLLTVDADDVREHGQLKACILARFYSAPADKNGWKTLSATDLAKALPFKRVAIQNALVEMVNDELLTKHRTKGKRYR